MKLDRGSWDAMDWSTCRHRNSECTRNHRPLDAAQLPNDRSSVDFFRAGHVHVMHCRGAAGCLLTDLVVLRWWAKGDGVELDAVSTENVTHTLQFSMAVVPHLNAGTTTTTTKTIRTNDEW